MSELKRTQLYDVHVQAGATMVDFGGWEMPIQYPSGIVSEHLYTRHACSLFDVSHMGRLLVEGPDRLAFLQHVLTSNVAGLDLNMAQYCIIPAPDGSAVDDAYLYRFEEERYLLVVNAANTDIDGTAALCEEIGVVAKAAIAKKALPKCNIVYRRGEEMKKDISAYLQVLYDASPAAVGGKLPDDNFYWVKPTTSQQVQHQVKKLFQ